MACNCNTPNVNQTFIIEQVEGTPVLSACTSLFTDMVKSCSGDTTITMGTGVVTFNGNVDGINSLTANTIEANTYLSGGTNILDVINGNDTYITNAILTATTLDLNRNDNVTLSVDLNPLISGKTDLTLFEVYTGATETILDSKIEDGVNFGGANEIFSGKSGTDLYFKTLSGGSNTTLTSIGDVVKIDVNIPPDANTFITGTSLNNKTYTINQNDGSSFSTDFEPLISGKTDLTSFNTHTGDTTIHFTKSSINLSDLGNTAHTHTLSEITDFNSYSGNVQTELDIKISGATNLSSEGVFAQKNGLDLEFKGITSTGGTVNISSNSSSVNLEVTIPSDQDKFVTGFTYNNANTFTISDNSGSTFNATINTVTGLTSNGNVEVIGNIIVTGGTGNVLTKQVYVENNLALDWDFPSSSIVLGNNSDDTIINGTSLTINSDTLVNGALTASTFYGDGSNLTGITDNFVTGQTFSNSTFILSTTRNDGTTFNTDLSVLATDVYVLSGVYNPATGIVTYTNSTGGTFQVSGFTTGMTDSYTTAANLNGETIEFDNNIQGSNLYSVSLSPVLSGKTDLTLFNTHTGDTNNPHQTSFSNLTSTAHTHTISDVINLQNELDGKLNVSEFNTYSGDVQTQIDNKLETSIFNSYTGSVVDVFVSSGNANSVTQQLSFTNTTGGTFNVTNSAALFSDNDVNVTGGTYNPSNGCVTFTTNSGTTFDVCGFVTGITDTFVTGGTLSGTDLVLERSNGIDVSGIDLSSLISGKLDITTFNTYTGDTETILNSKTDNTDFTSHTGDTTIHYTKSSINLSDLGSSAHTHTISEVINLQSELDGKTDLTLFNSHTGDTSNPHQTSFSSLTSTAHTHTISEVVNLQTELDGKTDNTDFTSHTGDTTIHYTKGSINLSDLGSSAHTHTLSEITDFNTYSGNVQTQLDTKIQNGVNSGGANEVFSGNSGTDLYFRTISGGSNTTISTINDIIKVDVTVPVDTNTFVTGGTYNPTTDIVALTRNDAVTIDITGVTSSLWSSNVNGIHYDNGNVGIGMSASSVNTKLEVNYSGTSERAFRIKNVDNNSQYNFGTELRDGEHLLRFDSDNSGITPLVLSSVNKVGVGIPNTIAPEATLHVYSTSGSQPIVLVEDETNPDTTPFIIDIDGNVGVSTGTPTEKLDVSGNTKISGTLNIGTLGTGTSVNNLGIDGNGNVVTGTTGGGGDNFYVTGFTYDDTNTFTISRNGGLGDLSATINTLTGLTINGVFSASTYTGLTLNDLDDVTTNIPASPDNTYQGELMYFDVVSNQWVSGAEYGNLGEVTIWGKKGSAGTIDKGCPVYIVGFDDDIHEVELANATTASTMPVIGFTAEDFDNAGIYPIVTFGKITGLDTTSGSITLNPFGETWEVNDVLYMAKSDGGLTKFRPSGTNTQIQRIAKVLRVSSNSGQLFIFNTARTAGLPNLTTDYLWLGNGNDTPQEVIRTDVGITTTGFTYNGNNTFTITDDNGGSYSATINQVSGLTINGDLNVTGDTTLNTLTATSITSNSAIDVFNGHINLRDNSYFLQGRTVGDSNVSLIGVDSQDRVFVGNAGYDTYIDSDTIVDGSLTATTLNITTIGGTTPITNLGVDSNGNVVSGTTGGSGEVNTATNLGGGTGLFAQKNGVDLEFKSLTSTGGTVTITNDSTTVNIESTGGGTGVSDANKIFSWFMTV